MASYKLDLPDQETLINIVIKLRFIHKGMAAHFFLKYKQFLTKMFESKNYPTTRHEGIDREWNYSSALS
jgi:hypothetical protein